MKNILKTGLMLLLAAVVLTNCTEDNEVKPADYYLRISGTDGNTFSGLPGETIEIGLNITSTSGINSLAQGSNSIAVTAGTLDTTITYSYAISEADSLGDEIELDFVATDTDGNTAMFNAEVTVGINAASFSEIGLIDLGAGEGAAEISAYSASAELLFVVNNGPGNNRIDVIDFSDPDDMELEEVLDLSAFGGGANSVALYGDRLVVAVENDDKQMNGVILVYDITDLETAPQQLTAGPLPDMVTFSPDGNYIVVANEGEPNDDYDNDPEGSISIYDASSATVTLSGTATFTTFNSQEVTLEAAGLRVFGPGATLAEDVEPEFITISADSETAYVTLQENNGVAVVDLSAATVTDILPLGFKDYTASGNAIDVTDEDDEYAVADLSGLKVFGVYQPDAIASFTIGTTEYLITANEGDSREYEGTPGFVGEARVADITLDATAFPNAATLQEDGNLGRLKIMKDLGDVDSDGDYDELYSYGARSFSIWNTSGTLVFDSSNDLDKQAVAAGIYADGRSDDKSVEPEGVVVGKVGPNTYAYIGLERVDAVAVYDITTPSAPSFVSMIRTGDAPEGLIFISADDSPTGTPLLVVSSEDDGTVRVYSAL